ncbi:MAG: L,D-transpeptidase family protein [Pseudomonadota bacterium]
MKYLVVILALILSACATPPPGTPAQEEQRVVQPNVPSPGFRHVDFVLVEKSQNRMYLMKDGKVIRDYHVALGKNPYGHKVKEGDDRTPEGRYNLFFKNPNSKFFRSIMLDYPNERDESIARARGVDPGKHIAIHGQPNEHFGPNEGVSQAFNWTDGCIAVTNPEMYEIWKLVDIDTPIEIRP